MGPVPSEGCAASKVKAGDTTEMMDVHGQARRYIIHVPAKYDGKQPVPLLLDFHPLLTDMSYERSSSGFAAVADMEGFIVVFPNGVSGAWNIGNCCTPPAQMVDDIGFAKQMVAKFEADACIDKNRVYAAGFSMGGGFTHQLACKAADIFAGGAPSSFDFSQENNRDCMPARPIAMIMYRGMGDTTIVPFNGGPTQPPTPNVSNVTVTFYGAQKTFQTWGMLDGCTDQPKMLPMMAGVNCQQYSMCKEGTEVVLCTNGGGHQQGPAAYMWSMLKKHGLRGPVDY